MMGGAWFREHFGDPDSCKLSDLEEIAIKSTAKQLGITDDPARVMTKLQKVDTHQNYNHHLHNVKYPPKLLILVLYS